MCGYKLSRGKDVFKAFVEELFNIKRFSTNEVERNSAKLMLNSVYGRFGMKEIISQIKVIKAKDYNEKMNKKMNHVVLTELANGDKLVKYSGKIDERLRKLIKYLEDESYKELKENKPMMNWNKVRGTLSAVQIAATISAYAKISINEYKILKIILVFTLILIV